MVDFGYLQPGNQTIDLTYTLTASQVGAGFGFTYTANIPEPSTWAMMLTGFAGLGFAALRRRQRAPAPLGRLTGLGPIGPRTHLKRLGASPSAEEVVSRVLSKVTGRSACRMIPRKGLDLPGETRSMGSRGSNLRLGFRSTGLDDAEREHLPLRG